MNGLPDCNLPDCASCGKSFGAHRRGKGGTRVVDAEGRLLMGCDAYDPIPAVPASPVQEETVPEGIPLTHAISFSPSENQRLVLCMDEAGVFQVLHIHPRQQDIRQIASGRAQDSLDPPTLSLVWARDRASASVKIRAAAQHLLRLLRDNC